jgi:hypothetical protein
MLVGVAVQPLLFFFCKQSSYTNGTFVSLICQLDIFT